ncbi:MULTISPECIES: hypothetical protein [Aminobacterium]|jgi:hypothetical protein|uniref:hypothetical protein n=1 Tax=Aminobacterium TaxID=81466 RepID=UPI00257E5A55|nr:hypothetical protein [Aminobacterium sp. UBA4987]
MNRHRKWLKDFPEIGHFVIAEMKKKEKLTERIEEDGNISIALRLESNQIVN